MLDCMIYHGRYCNDRFYSDPECRCIMRGHCQTLTAKWKVSWGWCTVYSVTCSTSFRETCFTHVICHHSTLPISVCLSFSLLATPANSVTQLSYVHSGHCSDTICKVVLGQVFHKIFLCWFVLWQDSDSLISIKVLFMYIF